MKVKRKYEKARNVRGRKGGIDIYEGRQGQE